MLCLLELRIYTGDGSLCRLCKTSISLCGAFGLIKLSTGLTLKRLKGDLGERLVVESLRLIGEMEEVEFVDNDEAFVTEIVFSGLGDWADFGRFGKGFVLSFGISRLNIEVLLSNDVCPGFSKFGFGLKISLGLVSFESLLLILFIDKV